MDKTSYVEYSKSLTTPVASGYTLKYEDALKRISLTVPSGSNVIDLPIHEVGRVGSIGGRVTAPMLFVRTKNGENHYINFSDPAEKRQWVAIFKRNGINTRFAFQRILVWVFGIILVLILLVAVFSAL